jgi:hypothetical protein
MSDVHIRHQFMLRKETMSSPVHKRRPFVVNGRETFSVPRQVCGARERSNNGSYCNHLREKAPTSWL